MEGPPGRDTFGLLLRKRVCALRNFKVSGTREIHVASEVGVDVPHIAE